jgi:outer membrane protein OmpA-like peptidoglycan-associated protein
MEETLRNMEVSFAGINESIDSSFCIDTDGKMTVFTDNGYPSFRSFPSFPERKIQKGSEWSGNAVRSVDPLNKGLHTKLDMYVLYTFSGEEVYQEKAVYRIKAQWQTNYGGTHLDPYGDRNLKKARGGHKADILIKKETGEVILVLDTVDETFFYADGSQVNFKGNITLFTEYPPAIQHDRLYDVLKASGGVLESSTESVPAEVNVLKNESSSTIADNLVEAIRAGTYGIFSDDGQTEIDDGSGQKFLIQKTKAGVRLSLRDIKFIPDSDEVLPEERYRIDRIASVLKTIDGHQFLIEGHTASVGKTEGEKALSLQRAQRIAKEFISRGIPSGRFICKGWGGTKPVADNTTDSGRAQNRRVEITILE